MTLIKKKVIVTRDNRHGYNEMVVDKTTTIYFLGIPIYKSNWFFIEGEGRYVYPLD